MASVKSIFADACYALGDLKACKRATAESTATDACYTLGNLNISERFATIERFGIRLKL